MYIHLFALHSPNTETYRFVSEFRKKDATISRLKLMWTSESPLVAMVEDRQLCTFRRMQTPATLSRASNAVTDFVGGNLLLLNVIQHLVVAHLLPSFLCPLKPYRKFGISGPH